MTMKLKIKDVLKKIRHRIPLQQLYKKFPVVQIFINSSERTTRYSISNFPSFLDPTNAKTCICTAVLFNQDGQKVFETKLKMKPFETMDINFADLMKNGAPPKFGLAVFKVEPENGIFFPHPNLERLTSHFFSTFFDKNGSVCGLIHPQSVFKPDPKPGLYWESNLKMDSTDLEWIELYQINPSTEPVQSKILLMDDKQKSIYSRDEIIKPFASRFCKIDAKSLSGSSKVHVALDGIAGENCKPIVFFKNKSNLVSAVHS